MKLSPASIVELIGVVGYWSLLIADLVIPGPENPALAVTRIFCVYLMISAFFYKVGFKAAIKKNNIYETSKA